MPLVESEEVELKHEALTIVEQAKLCQIVDQPSYDSAAKLLLDAIIPFRKRWENYWKPLKEAAWSAHKGIMDKFNEGDKPAEAAERTVKAEIRRWDDQQARIQQELQRKAQEEAEAREREERLKAAVLAEQSGATAEEVDAIVESPVAVVAAPVERTYERSAGISGRDNWKCRVTDVKALCKAIAAGKVPVNYIIPNESVLNARAKADRETLNIPGCVPYNERIIAGRSR